MLILEQENKLRLTSGVSMTAMLIFWPILMKFSLITILYDKIAHAKNQLDPNMFWIKVHNLSYLFLLLVVLGTRLKLNEISFSHPCKKTMSKASNCKISMI